MTSIARLTVFGGRVLAAFCLYVGLELAARLLGAGGGSQSPIAVFGVAGFTWLTIFAVGYLFAAVGIWIGSNWGCVVATGTAGAELALTLMGNADIRLPSTDFLMTLVILIAAVGLCIFSHIGKAGAVHD